MANAPANTAPCAMAPLGTAAGSSAGSARPLENQPKKRGPKPGFRRSANQSVAAGQSRPGAAKIWQYDSAHSVSMMAASNSESNANVNNNNNNKQQRYFNDPYTFQCDSFASGVNYHEPVSIVALFEIQFISSVFPSKNSLLFYTCATHKFSYVSVLAFEFEFNPFAPTRGQ